jgi:hypothetical protein
MPTPSTSQSDKVIAQPDAQDAPLSGLEISGAICARVIHDLSNLLSGIIGNAEYAQTEGVDPASVQKAIEAIGLSANSAGKLLGQCLPLQKLISGQSAPADVADVAAVIAGSAGLAPGWRVLEPNDLAGQVRVHPRWLTAAVWQLARETGSPHGEVEFAAGPGVFPIVWRGNTTRGRSVELFQITLRYRSDQPFAGLKGSISPEGFPLLAAHELIHRMKGQVDSRPKPPGRQEISVVLPLL